MSGGNSLGGGFKPGRSPALLRQGAHREGAGLLTGLKKGARERPRRARPRRGRPRRNKFRTRSRGMGAGEAGPGDGRGFESSQARRPLRKGQRGEEGAGTCFQDHLAFGRTGFTGARWGRERSREADEEFPGVVGQGQGESSSDPSSGSRDCRGGDSKPKAKALCGD